MAKRHPALILLSNDHHQGLGLALRCRKYALGQLNPGDPTAMKACFTEVSRFLNECLAAHFRAEETVLFPLMTNYQECRDLVVRLESEHREFHKMAAGIVKSGELRKYLFDFGDLLEQHIRSEEQRLFPAFETLVPEANAEHAGREIKRLLEEKPSAGSKGDLNKP